jgi:hypothetical protein
MLLAGFEYCVPNAPVELLKANIANRCEEVEVDCPIAKAVRAVFQFVPYIEFPVEVVAVLVPKPVLSDH